MQQRTIKLTHLHCPLNRTAPTVLIFTISLLIFSTKDCARTNFSQVSMPTSSSWMCESSEQRRWRQWTLPSGYRTMGATPPPSPGPSPTPSCVNPQRARTKICWTSTVMPSSVSRSQLVTDKELCRQTAIFNRFCQLLGSCLVKGCNCYCFASNSCACCRQLFIRLLSEELLLAMLLITVAGIQLPQKVYYWHCICRIRS